MRHLIGCDHLQEGAFFEKGLDSQHSWWIASLWIADTGED
jgi:hypothetical protein